MQATIFISSKDRALRSQLAPKLLGAQQIRRQTHLLEQLLRRLGLASKLGDDLVLALLVLALAELLKMSLIWTIGDAEGSDLASRISTFDRLARP